MHATKMLGVEVFAVKDSPARESRQASILRVREGGTIAKRRRRFARSPGALVLLTDPVIQNKVLGRTMAFPLILASKGRGTTREAENADKWASMLFPDVIL